VEGNSSNDDRAAGAPRFPISILASRANGPARSREKMRCADFRVFSLRVQGLPLPREV